MASYSTQPIQNVAAPTHWVPSTTRVMSAIERTAEAVAGSSCPVMLVGPAGVGKHALAFRIYEQSDRVNGSFLELNCAKAPVDLFRAGSRYLGCGTLYLDDPSALSVALQSALMDLYFGMPANWSKLPRLIAGCERADIENVLPHSLLRCMQATVVLHLPELHERGRDILALAHNFISNYADVFGRPEPEMSEELKEFFLAYCWPGNLDELEAACKTLVALSDPRAAIAAVRASALRPVSPNDATKNTSLKQAARRAAQRAEHALISDVLQITGGNRKQAARQLQISYKALLYKLKELGAAGCGVAAQEQGD